MEGVTIDGATPLFNSCSSGSAACVRLMLQHGATIHTPYLLASPIHEAAKKGVCVCVCVCVMYISVKTWIFECTDSDAVSPSGHAECLELLLSYGAHIDMELEVVGTPLYSACKARAEGCVGVLLYLGNV